MPPAGTSTGRRRRFSRALLIACGLVAALALPLAAQEPTPDPPALTHRLLDGPPPIEIDAPPVALRSIEFDVTLRAADLPAPVCRVEILDPSGTILAQGELAEHDETSLTVSSPESVTLRVVLPDHYRDPAAFEIRAVAAWLSVLPAVIAILLALAFRQVLPALFAGVWVGAWVVLGNGFTALWRTMDQYIIPALTDSDRLKILVFSLVLGGMVGILSRSGGTIALVEALKPYATNSRRGQVVAWVLGLVIFFDDYANTLLVGNTMRPVTDRLKVSREKLAYIVDSTAAPIASIALVSTWIGYEVGLIGQSLVSIGSDLDPYSVFLRSLPYNFYPILSLVLGLAIATTGRDWGPMAAAERRAATGKIFDDGDVPLSDFDSEGLGAIEDKPRRWYNAAIPIVTVVTVAFGGIWSTGKASLAADGYEPAGGFIKYLGDVLGAGSSYDALLWASLSGSLVALVLVVVQRILTLNEATLAWAAGIKSMMFAVLILTLAWSISDVSGVLNTKGFLVAALGDSLDPRLLPAIIFLLASMTSFATGTSWTTMGILIPLAVPTAFALAQGAGLDESTSMAILLASVSSVLAGAIFGDHCSPISDTTVLSSTASGCDHIAHVRTQLPYAIFVGVIAIAVGYIPAGYGMSPWISLVLASGLLIGGLRFLGSPDRN